MALCKAVQFRITCYNFVSENHQTESTLHHYFVIHGDQHVSCFFSTSKQNIYGTREPSTGRHLAALLFRPGLVHFFVQAAAGSISSNILHG